MITNRFVAPILSLLVSSCVSIAEDERISELCESVKYKDGWRYQAQYPDELKQFEHFREEKQLLYWFRNEKGDFLLCTRSIRGTGCGEQQRQFHKVDGVWYQKPGITIVICH